MLLGRTNFRTSPARIATPQFGEGSQGRTNEGAPNKVLQWTRPCSALRVVHVAERAVSQKHDDPANAGVHPQNRKRETMAKLEHCLISVDLANSLRAVVDALGVKVPAGGPFS